MSKPHCILRVPLVALVALGLWIALQVAGAAQSSGTPIGDWRDIRGTNYVINSHAAVDNVDMWLSPNVLAGTFDPVVVEQELGVIAAAGLDSVRIFGSFYAWTAARSDYLANLATTLAICRRYELYVTFVLWDGFGADGLNRVFDAPALTAAIGREVAAAVTRKTSGPSQPTNMGGAWVASPGSRFIAEWPDPATWPPRLRHYADGYLDDIGGLFGGHYGDVFLSYDVMNEPEAMISFGVPVSVARLVDLVARLAAYSRGRLIPLHPRAKFTVGNAVAAIGVEMHRKLAEIANTGLDYLCYHDYAVTDADQRAADAALTGDRAGLEVVCGEFFNASAQGHFDEFVRTITAHRLGGQMWGAIQDRIFVGRYTALAGAFPSQPAKWWTYDTGIYRSVVDAGQPTTLRYVAKNATFERALLSWTSGKPQAPPIWITLDTWRPDPNDRKLVRLRVRGRPGLPLRILTYDGGIKAPLVAFPGLGELLLDGPGVNSIAADPLEPNPKQGGVGEQTVDLRLLRSAWIQAVIGGDYTPANWEQAVQTLACPPKAVIIP